MSKEKDANTHDWRQVLRRLDDVRWELPQDFMPGMRVPGLILADDALMDTMASDMAVQQVANVGSSADLPTSLKISEKTFAALKPVGSVASNGEGRASVDFPEVVGRYVILKWKPASAQGDAFSIAQVAAFGVSKHLGAVQGTDGKEMNDGKAMTDGKEAMYGEGGKESPGEGLDEAQAPAEGPPPALPPVPPFTFIPQLPPTSP